MRTITIRGADLMALDTVAAFYSRDGLLAAHKQYPSEPQIGWQRSDGWAITHIGTGLQVGSRDTRKEAIALRVVLGSLGNRWAFADSDSVDLLALRLDCLALLNDGSLHA